jgi:hypothetical protein
MTDEPEAESSKPIALGGPTSHDPAVPKPAAPEPAAPEPAAPEPAAPEPAAPEPMAPDPAAPGPAAPEPAAPEPLPPERAEPEPFVPEPAAVPPKAVAAEPPAVTPVPERQRRGVLLPLLGLLGFVILAGAIAYLYVRPVPMPSAPAMPPDESGAVATLQKDVATLKTQLAALDARETSDVAALHKAIAALPAPAPASSPTPSPAPAAVTASPPPTAPSPAAAAPAVASAAPDNALQQQLSALSDRLSQVQAAEAAQAQQTQALPSAADVANLAKRLDTVAQRETKDGDAVRQDLSLVQQQLASVTSQTQSVAKTASALPQLTAKADRLSQLVRAEEALNAGMPLGNITDAPPALARFAATAPPTEAQLRLSYVQAAQAADKAGQPQPDQGRFWHRVLVHVEDLVTLRQGDHVILGDETSGVLAHAQRLLDAGDLSGALSVLDTLTGPAAAAMAPWEAQAKAVVAARQALAQMAAS